MKKLMFKVENLGLNELGAQELNEYYKENIERGFVNEFKLNEIIDTCKKKIYKQSKSFLEVRIVFFLKQCRTKTALANRAT